MKSGMKFVASQGGFLGSLALVVGGISKNIEILSAVKISLNKAAGTAKFETTNLDMAITSILECEVFEEGEICVDVLKLIEIAKKLNSAEKVTCEVKLEPVPTMHIKNGKSKFSVQGKTVADYPSISLGEAKASLEVDSKKLLMLIDKTKFSIYPTETRFNLNGILLHLKKEGEMAHLCAVSTDGHRLSFCKLEIEAEFRAFPKVILPKKAVFELRKIFDSIENEDVLVEITDRMAVFSAKSFKIVTKLIDAEFPDYEKVVPSGNTKTLVVERKALMQLVERVSAIYVNSQESGVKLSISGNLLTVASRKSDIDAGFDELDVEFDGGDIEITYNYSYLLEILNHISSDKVKVMLSDARVPAIFRDANVDSYFYILMPMRV